MQRIKNVCLKSVSSFVARRLKFWCNIKRLDLYFLMFTNLNIDNPISFFPVSVAYRVVAERSRQRDRNACWRLVRLSKTCWATAFLMCTSKVSLKQLLLDLLFNLQGFVIHVSAYQMYEIKSATLHAPIIGSSLSSLSAFDITMLTNEHPDGKSSCDQL